MRSFVFVLASALAACGVGSGPADAPANETEATKDSGSKACDVLTAADAAKALGRDVQKLDASGGPAGLDICQFGYQGERMMDTGNASVTVQPVDLASLKEGVAAQEYAIEPVPGLGDEAFWSPEAGLYIGKGNRSAIYLVGVGGESEAQNKERAIALAKATVSRL